MQEIRRFIPDLNGYRTGLRDFRYDGSRERKEQLYQTLDEIFDPLPRNLDARQTTFMLFNVLRFFDRTTARHSFELARLSDQVAVPVFCRINRSRINIEALGNAALLHDIGKIGILCALNMPIIDRQKTEFRILHAYFTRHILQKFPSLRDVEPIASATHVKSNGLSYPHDIPWDTVGVEAKILAVIDALHSITHERPGDPPQSRIAALHILQKKGFDQVIVGIIADLLFKIPVHLIPDV